MAKQQRPRSRKGNATGRNESEQYVPLSYPLLRSLAWRSLSGPAVKVYLELRSRYWGGNNGDLSLGLDEGKRLLGLGKTTVDNAFYELSVKGFIKLNRAGLFEKRLARTWFVTDRAEGPGKMPTNDWKTWNGQFSPRPKRKPLVGDDHEEIWQAVP